MHTRDAARPPRRARRRDAVRAALLDVIARAAAPHERRGPAFRAAPTAPETLARRELAWVAALAGGDEAGFTARLAERGLTRAAARAGLADVVVARPAALPRWAHDVLDLFDGRATDWAALPHVRPFVLGELADEQTLAATDSRAADAWPLAPAFAPFVRRGAAHVAAACARHGEELEEGARRACVAHLAGRLGSACAQLLLERAPNDPFADAPSRQAPTVGRRVFGTLPADAAPAEVLARWRALLAEYPVAAHVVATAWRQWCDSTEELIARLAADRPRLQAALGGGAPLGALRECRAGAGDLHGHGRAVALLGFASGARAVYKPKDLRVAAAYMALAESLNAAGLSVPLGTRAVVAGAGYAWEAFVAGAPCADTAAVARFYRRIGAHARLLQLLDGTDFTGDNVVAAGEHPVLVDLEMACAPRLDPTDPDATERATQRAAHEAALAAPVRCGLITAPLVGDEGRRPAELGALAGAAPAIAPFRQRVLRRVGAGHELHAEYPAFPTNGATPVLDGRPVRPADHFAHVVDGYVELTAVLRAAAGAGRGADTPFARALAALADAPVRFLARDTHIYARMLQASLTPPRLRDGVERELCLERLWRGRFPSPAVVQAEVDGLRRLDIPYFTACPGDDALVTDEGARVPGFFEAPAIDGVRARLAALRGAPPAPAREREAIGAALFVLAPDWPPLPAAPHRERGRRGARGTRRTAHDWLAAAESAADAVRAGAVSADDDGASGDLAWVAAAYRATSDSWLFAPMGPDLLGGSAGLGLVLAEVAAAGGAPRFAADARRALAPVARRLAALDAAAMARTAPGAHVGWGGWLYAVARAGVALGDARLGDVAAAAAERVAAVATSGALDAAPTDALGGRAGLLLALAALPAGAAAVGGQAIARGLLVRAAADRLDALRVPPAARALAVLPGARWGVQLALAAAASRGWLDAADAAAARALLARATDVPPMEDDTAGDALARRRLGALLGVTPSGDAARAGGPDVWSLLVRGEHALAGGDWDGAREVAAALCAVRRRTGRWLGAVRAADRHLPCAVLGTGAVAHFLCRVASPEAGASLRTLV